MCHYKEYLANRRHIVVEGLKDNTAYAKSAYCSPIKVLGEEYLDLIYFEDALGDEAAKKFLNGVVKHMSPASPVMFVMDMSYAVAYIDAILTVVEDICSRADNGILDIKAWFKVFATDRQLVEKYSTKMLIWSENSKLARTVADLFTAPFFVWYNSYTKAILGYKH